MEKIRTSKSAELKYFSILQTFSAQETQRFILFLQSPFYNQNEILSKLYDSIRKNKEQNPLPTTIWKAISPNKKFNNTRYHRLISDLNKLAELFLTTQAFYKDMAQKNIYQLKAFNQRGLDKQYLYALSQFEKIIPQQQFKQPKDFWIQYALETEKYVFFERHQNRGVKSNIDKQLQSLDNFYLMHKLQGWCALLHYKTVNTLESSVQLDKQLLEFLEQNHSKSEPLIRAYYFILKSFLNPDNETFFKQQKKMLAAKNNFSTHTLSNLYLYAINYCIQKINAGNSKYNEEIFELYKKYVAIIVTDKQQQLSPWDYKNIITVALRLKQYSWAEKFILTNNSFLAKEHQHNALNYNLAKVNFEKKDFGKCLELLQMVDFNDVFYLLDTKLTQIKALFELNEKDTLKDLLKSFRLLLRRKKIITEQHQLVYGNFVRFTSIFINSKKFDRKKIIVAIKQNQHLVDKNWLLEKATN